MSQRAVDRANMTNLITYEILRTTLDDGKTELHKRMVCDSEETPRTFCRRFNAWAKRNDFDNHYSYREIGRSETLVSHSG